MSKSWLKLALKPTVVCCLLVVCHSVVRCEDLPLADVPGGPQGGLVSGAGSSGTLVREKRQIGSNSDENKQGFTEEEKQALLAMHNSHRSTANPSAANMIEVRWNDEIEAFAQEWASNCEFKHRSNRDLGEWKNMGENIFFTSGGSYNVKSAVDWWWNEIEYYTFETRECAENEQCAHYVTAAWARTEYIGCGIQRCQTLPTVLPSNKAYLFICNYSGRFWSNTDPFQTGPSCSNCPLTYPRCRYNLCVTQNMLDNCEGYNGTTIYISKTRDNAKTDPMYCPGFVDNPSTPAPMTTVTEDSQPSTGSDGYSHNTMPSNVEETTQDSDGGASAHGFPCLPLVAFFVYSLSLF